MSSKLIIAFPSLLNLNSPFIPTVFLFPFGALIFFLFRFPTAPDPAHYDEPKFIRESFLKRNLKINLEICKIQPPRFNRLHIDELRSQRPDGSSSESMHQRLPGFRDSSPGAQPGPFVRRSSLDGSRDWTVHVSPGFHSHSDLCVYMTMGI
jgi:hypothetical protein